MADGEIEIEEKGKKERNCSLLCMTIVGCSSGRLHERAKVCYQVSQNLRGNKTNKKEVSPDFFESWFIIKRISDTLFSETISSFSHRGSKTFCLFPTNLATPGNITRNNVSATMFPSLTRP